MRRVRILHVHGWVHSEILALGWQNYTRMDKRYKMNTNIYIELGKWMSEFGFDLVLLIIAEIVNGAYMVPWQRKPVIISLFIKSIYFWTFGANNRRNIVKMNSLKYSERFTGNIALEII